MLSKDLLDSKSEEGKEFFEAMMGLMEWGGHANVADIFPWLKWMDPQGLCRKMRRDLGKAMEIASKFVKERLENGGGGDSGDFLDVLLGFQGNGKDEPEEIFMAGSETTSSTTEWALTELLRHPKMEETDIENLPFLQAVVKETFRLHPPIPLLVPRRAMRDTTFMGYHVPKDTQVLVNAWSIGRDPSQWEDPWSFKPDRFLGSKVDYRGQHYQFLPFGAGRRMCAGVPLAHRVLHLILGTLLHEFSWEAKVDPSTFNMDDRLGITMRKSESLMVVPKKRGRV
ncbi:Cytochrome P450 76A2 [Linum perenne]